MQRKLCVGVLGHRRPRCFRGQHRARWFPRSPEKPAHGQWLCLPGTAASGVAGLPITPTRYTSTSPFHDGLVTIHQAGEKNTGFSEYTFNCQSSYSFTSGPLKGPGVFADVRTWARNRAHSTVFPGASAAKQARVLYRLPNATVFNVNLNYKYRLPWLGERFTWSTQLNVLDAFNHDKVWILPSPGNGNTLNARLSAQPRQFVFSNTLSF